MKWQANGRQMKGKNRQERGRVCMRQTVITEGASVELGGIVEGTDTAPSYSDAFFPCSLLLILVLAQFSRNRRTKMKKIK